MIELQPTIQEKRRILESKNREEGNGKPRRLFSLDMIPIDGCFKDCGILFFVVDCRLSGDGSHIINSRTLEEEEEALRTWYGIYTTFICPVKLMTAAGLKWERGNSNCNHRVRDIDPCHLPSGHTVHLDHKTSKQVFSCSAP